MSDISPVTPVLLSAIPASPQQNRRALVISLVLFVGVLATIPFAQIGAPHFPAFVLLQQTLLLANDMITAAVLFAQYWIGRNRTLNVLAAGYLFTSLIVIPHALTFPGAFSEAGLLGAGPQSAAWLYLGWHAVLPVTTIVFALRPNDQVAVEPPGGVNAAISGAVLSAAALIFVFVEVPEFVKMTT